MNFVLSHLGRSSACLLAALALAACVSTSPDVLLSAEPVGEAQKTGTFPKIGNVPVGNTQQLTPTEKAAVKTELNSDVQPGRAQAAQDSTAAYQSEVDSLKKLAADRQKTLRKQIEENNRIE